MSIADDNIVDTLRGFAYIVDNSKDTCRVVMLGGFIFDEAADEIERLQQVNSRLVNCLKWAMDGRDMPEDMQDLIQVCEESDKQ